MRRPAGPRRAAGRLGALARRFARTRDGVAAVEFAMILPLMLLLYVGMAELSRALANSRKVTLLSRTVSDLVARGTNLSQDAMKDVFGASGAVLAPFDDTGAVTKVSAVGVYKVGSDFKAYICSSWSRTGTTDADGRKVGLASASPNFPAVPEAFKQEGMRYVLTEVTMDYVPMLGTTLLTVLSQWAKPTFISQNGNIPLQETTPWPVRAGQTYNSAVPEITLPGDNKACPAKIN